jgi:NhaP-type Na+/H+ or K+/H+ antiporter
MTFATWCLFLGGLLILMGLSRSVLHSLPISSAALYMLIGYAAGPDQLGWMTLHLSQSGNAHFVEMLTEVAVLVSLFAVGLRLQVKVFDGTWRVPVLLATVAMVITIAAMTTVGMVLGLSLGAAVLTAAILAPTDPVLASDVQVRHEKDRDGLRFGLTAEGGLNDGAAFPFVMLGLGLLGAHDLGPWGVRWLGVDVLWSIVGGLGLGWLCGAGFTRLVVFLRHSKHQALGMESFLALGLIGVTYGVALHASVYGFLAVFVAGLGMRDVERRAAADVPESEMSNDDEPKPPENSPAGAAAEVTTLAMEFVQDLEKFVELASMLIIGSLLSTSMLTAHNFLLAAMLIFVARPLAVIVTTGFSRWTPTQRRLGAWFGIRGVGSLYYLAYAINHHTPAAGVKAMSDAVLLTIAVSVVLHGSSATPLMAWYQRLRDRPGRVRNRRGAETDSGPAE